MRRTSRVGVAGVLAMVFLALDAWAATPVKLVDTKANEVSPAVADGWLAWSAWNNRADRFIAWLDPTGPDGPRKIRTPFSTFVGDIVLDGPRAGQVVTWQFEGRNGQIKFYDVATREILNAPSGVNTSKSEAFASLSGARLLFGRGPLDASYARSVLLYRLDTGAIRTIATDRRPVFIPDQVNGDYVVYTHLTNSGAEVFRYQISTDRRMRIPPGDPGRANYFGSVLTDGTVFFVEGSATRCGKNTRIMRLRNGRVTAIAAVPDGFEIGSMNARDIDGETHVVFSRLSCANLSGGIYEVVL